MGAARKLAANVFVGGRLFLAGSSPEKEFADQITNPKAWGGEKAAEAAQAPAPKTEEPDGTPPTLEVKSYDGNAEELAAEAAERGVNVEGTGAKGKVLKKDLVTALQAADVAAASE